MGLGDKIRKHREHKNMSRDALSREANIASSTMYKIEKGLISPTYEIVKRLSTALGISLNEVEGKKFKNDKKQN